MKKHFLKKIRTFSFIINLIFFWICVIVLSLEERAILCKSVLKDEARSLLTARHRFPFFLIKNELRKEENKIMCPLFPFSFWLCGHTCFLFSSFFIKRKIRFNYFIKKRNQKIIFNKISILYNFLLFFKNKNLINFFLTYRSFFFFKNYFILIMWA